MAYARYLWLLFISNLFVTFSICSLTIWPVSYTNTKKKKLQMSVKIKVSDFQMMIQKLKLSCKTWSTMDICTCALPHAFPWWTLSCKYPVIKLCSVCDFHRKCDESWVVKFLFELENFCVCTFLARSSDKSHKITVLELPAWGRCVDIGWSGWVEVCVCFWTQEPSFGARVDCVLWKDSSLIFLVKQEYTLETCLAVQQADSIACTISSHEASNVELETVLEDSYCILHSIYFHINFAFVFHKHTCYPQKNFYFFIMR